MEFEHNTVTAKSWFRLNTRALIIIAHCRSKLVQIKSTL